MTTVEEDGIEVNENVAWWRAQALALATELSSVKGQYEAELSELRRQTDEAIAWLQEKLAEERRSNRPSFSRLKALLKNQGAR